VDIVTPKPLRRESIKCTVASLRDTLAIASLSTMQLAAGGAPGSSSGSPGKGGAGGSSGIGKDAGAKRYEASAHEKEGRRAELQLRREQRERDKRTRELMIAEKKAMAAAVAAGGVYVPSAANSGIASLKKRSSASGCAGCGSASPGRASPSSFLAAHEPSSSSNGPPTALFNGPPAALSVLAAHAPPSEEGAAAAGGEGNNRPDEGKRGGGAMAEPQPEGGAGAQHQQQQQQQQPQQGSRGAAQAGGGAAALPPFQLSVQTGPPANGKGAPPAVERLTAEGLGPQRGGVERAGHSPYGSPAGAAAGCRSLAARRGSPARNRPAALQVPRTAYLGQHT
jgi:hypothetical protein